MRVVCRQLTFDKGHAINRAAQLSLHNASHVNVPLHTGGHMVASGGLFAASIRHHHGIFYIVCTNASFNPGIKVDNFLISTTDIWASTWSDPISIPYKGIDPSLFFEGDRAFVQGSFSLGMDKHPSCTIKQFEIDISTGRQLTEAREIWSGFSQIDTEAPHIYKVNGWYYLLVAEGGTFEHHMVSVARAKDIWGPYESFAQNPILTADGKHGQYVQNTGHADLVEDASGNWWAVLLAVRSERTCRPLGRETFLAPVQWTEEGWPAISQPQAGSIENTIELPFVSHAARNAFDKSVSILPTRLEDLYIRDVDTTSYTLPSRQSGAFLHLVPSIQTLSSPSGTSTFLGRRQRSLRAEALASIDLSSRHGSRPRSIITGLAVYKDHLRHLILSFDFEDNKVDFQAINSTTGLHKTIHFDRKVDPQADTIHLKIVCSPTTYHGYVASSANAEQTPWDLVGQWTTESIAAREMTGPILGVFAHVTAQIATSSEVVFRSFEVVN